jgi:hypothetical protein
MIAAGISILRVKDDSNESKVCGDKDDLKIVR